MSTGRSICAAAILTLLAAVTAAQNHLPVGNVLHGFGGGRLGLLDTGGQVVTPLQIFPSPAGIDAFVLDPDSPDDLLVMASTGLIHRATVTPGGVTTTQITQVPLPFTKQLSLDQTGALIVVAETLMGEVFSVDTTTGAITTLVDTTWPDSIRCGAIDPTTGDYYIGAGSTLYRVVVSPPNGTFARTPIYTGSTTISTLTFDPLHPEFVVFSEGQAMRRIDKNTLGVQDFFTSGIFSVDSIRPDEQGTYVVTHSRDMYRVANPMADPMGSVVPQFLGHNPEGCCSFIDVAVVGGTFTPYNLELTTAPGGVASLTLRNVPVGVGQTWLFISTFTNQPRGAGGLFGIVPDGLTLTLISSFPNPTPGNVLHSLGAPPLFVPFPDMSIFAGQTWDFVDVAFGVLGDFLGRTNVDRVTWQ